MKKLIDTFYVHKSNLEELMDKIPGFEDTSVLSWAIYYMTTQRLEYEIIKYDAKNHTFSLIQCPTWDVRYEPVAGDSYIFKKYEVPPKMRTGGTTVYHQKHLFVSDNYTGFDIEKSKERTELLESIPWYKENKSRIGSKKIWEEFLKSQDLEKYMV